MPYHVKKVAIPWYAIIRSEIYCTSHDWSVPQCGGWTKLPTSQWWSARCLLHTQDGARLDVVANGFWTRYQHCLNLWIALFLYRQSGTANRPGKFNSKKNKHRLLLVKFVCLIDARKLLVKSNQLKPPLLIKPDKSVHERRIEKDGIDNGQIDHCRFYGHLFKVALRSQV